MMATEIKSTTGYLRHFAGAEYDVASGYAHFNMDIGNKVAANSGAIHDVTIGQAGEEFLKSYWKFLGVEMLTDIRPIILPTAGGALDVVAAFLKSQDVSARVVTPTLDIIPAFLRKNGVSIQPISESVLGSPSLYAQENWQSNKTALVIVNPNNPTGSFLDGKALLELGRFCKAAGIILVVDNCFRAFASCESGDDITALRASGCSFISIRDTGKTISAGGQKTGFIMASPDLREGIQEFADLYGTTPVPALLAIRDAAENIMHHGGREKVLNLIEKNRGTLKKWLSGSPLVPVEPGCSVSVAWIKLPSDWSSVGFASALFKEHDVAVAPGEHFYWDRNLQSQTQPIAPYIRVALARDAPYLETAAARLAQFARTYMPLKVA